MRALAPLPKHQLREINNGMTPNHMNPPNRNAATNNASAMIFHSSVIGRKLINDEGGSYSV
jgi:hypothetical protein